MDNYLDNNVVLDDLVYRIDRRPVTTHKLNTDKIKTVEDIAKILREIVVVNLREGTTCDLYENLKEYFD